MSLRLMCVAVLDFCAYETAPNVTVTEFCCNEIHSVIKQRIVIFLFLFLNLELSFLFIHSAFFHTSIYAPKERLKLKSNSENSKLTSFFFFVLFVCFYRHL